MNIPIISDTLSLEIAKWRWRILCSTYFGYAGFYLTRNVFPVCKETIRSEFGIQPHEVAHLWSTYLTAYMLGQFLVSVFGRRASARLLLLLGLGGSIVVSVLWGVSNSYPTFMFLMGVNGIAQSLGWPGCIGAVAEWLRPRERSAVMGIWSTNLIVGNMMVKVLSGWLLARSGWQQAYFGCALAALATWFVLLLWQRDRPEDIGLRPLVDPEGTEPRLVRASNSAQLHLRDYFRLAWNPVVLLIAVGYFSIKVMRYSIDSWLPTFLKMHGLKVSAAAYWSTIYDLAGFLGMVMIGWMVTNWFRGKWYWVCVLLGLGMAVGYQVLVNIGPNPYAVACCFGFIGFTVYAADSLLKGLACIEVAGERNGVAVAGFVNGVASIGPVFQEELIGHWLDQGKSGIGRANLMGLAFAVTFTLTMGIISWQAHRRRSGYGPDIRTPSTLS